VITRHRDKCCICGSSVSIIRDLPSFPLTDMLTDEKPSDSDMFVDQQLQRCPKCSHVQVGALPDPAVLYGDNYAFRTSRSDSSIKHKKRFYQFMREIIGDRAFKNVVEIGANDLGTLGLLSQFGENITAIDPILKEGYFPGVTIIGDFYENVDFSKFRNSLVVSSHVLEHIEEPCILMESLQQLDDKSIIALEFPCLDALVKYGRFDQVYTHHCQYFSMRSIAYLAKKFGFGIMGFDFNMQYWGTFMVLLSKLNGITYSFKPIESEEIIRKFNFFISRMGIMSEELPSGNLIGYGAALQLPVLTYYMPSLLNMKYIVDDDVSKDKKYFVNLPISITNEYAVDGMDVVVTAINFSRPIVDKLLKSNPKSIILPMGIM